MRPMLFLDIDGVLNAHEKHPNGYRGIKPECVYRLNRIIAETGAMVVISSSWRYMLHGAAVTLAGFRYLLLIHGLSRDAVIIGFTERDEVVRGRGEQILEWIRPWLWPSRPRYVVLDDGSDSAPGPHETRTLTESLTKFHAGHLVLTDGSVGLTDADADRAIAILKGDRP
jgi:hypothetical protein